MKPEQRFMRVLMTCMLMALAACNLPGAAATIAPAPTAENPVASAPAGTSITSSSPTANQQAEHRIGIRVTNGVGEFYDGETSKQFIPRGMNYIHLGPQTNPYGQTTTYHAVFDPDKYDPSRVSAALKRMHDDGYNVVRVFLSQNTMGTQSDGLSPAYMNNIVAFMTQAKQNQIYVMFTQDWLPGGKYDTIIGRDCCTNFNLMNLNYLSPAGLDANVAFFKDFVQSLIDLHAPLDAIFSYELRNEMFYERDQPPLSLTQGKITAANGKTYDMASSQDKASMVDENLVYWIDTVRAAILEEDPTALVSVGFFHPQEPNPARIGDMRLAVTEPAIWQSKADFIDLHAYPGFELSLNQYVENFGLKDMRQKPVVMGEFGGEVTRFASLDAAAQTFVDWQVESCQYGFDGWLFWTWDDTEEPGFFNALGQDGKIEQALAPLTRPDPCSAESTGAGSTAGASPTNLALNAQVTASASLPDQPPANAVDGAIETLWGAGSGPEQWIQIDLGQPRAISEVRLVVSQYPEGETVHQLWAGPAANNLSLIREFKGTTKDLDTLVYLAPTPLTGIRVIKIVTTQSPSWVAWREIEVRQP